MMADAMDRAPRWLPLLMGLILTAEHARHGAWGWSLLALGLGIGWTAGWSRPWPWVHSVGLLGGVALSVLALLPAGSSLSALIASSLALLSWDRADAEGGDDDGARPPRTTLALLRGRRVMAVIVLGLGMSALALSTDLQINRTAVGLLGLAALAGLRWIVRAIQRGQSRR
jgi:hypothetical protein